MKDIYFEEKYGRINENIEDGTSCYYEYDHEVGNITYSFIKRQIPQDIEGEIYYDIVSPYGYGGPIINTCKNHEKLITNYNLAFSKFCYDNNIVSEFVRFHPILQNQTDFKLFYNLELSRQTLATNLIDYKNPFQEEFSKSTRKTIRKQLRDGMTYNVVEAPESINDFIKFYYSTMDRNKATDFYYFNEVYFNDFIKYFPENIILVEVKYEDKIIAMGFYLSYKDYLHAHLSGTLSEYFNLSPAYLIKYAITEWGKERGYSYIHHGGGTNSSDENSLYKFKKRFSQNTQFDFFIGKKIWNETVYNKLCELNNVDQSEDYFPAYRLTK